MNIHALWLVLLTSTALPAWAASCNVKAADQPARPAWVNGTQAEGDDKFYGVGVADIAGSDVVSAIAEARSRANAELAQSVRVNITSTLKSSESKLTDNGKTAVRSSFEAVSASVTHLTLQSVKVDSQWIDGAGCRVWLRVSVSREEAQRAQRQETSNRLVLSFEEQMTLSEDAARSVPERERALAAAAEILPLIEPALVPSFSADAGRIRIESERATVADARRVYNGYGDHLSRHLRAYGQMSAATASGARRAAAANALTLLQSMQAMAPQGMPGLALPFKTPERMAQLFGELGTPCMATKWFEEQGRPLPSNIAGAASCGLPELSRERRQLHLAGRNVQLVCSISIDGQTRAWDKACASMQEKMVRDGAVIISPSAPPNASVYRVEISASGALKKRQDPDSQATSYRFEGQIAASLKGPDQLDIVDSYEGITGWNPVSAAMTTDVLAINVVTRFDNKISKNWEK